VADQVQHSAGDQRFQARPLAAIAKPSPHGAGDLGDLGYGQAAAPPVPVTPVHHRHQLLARCRVRRQMGSTARAAKASTMAAPINSAMVA